MLCLNVKRFFAAIFNLIFSLCINDIICRRGKAPESPHGNSETQNLSFFSHQDEIVIVTRIRGEEEGTFRQNSHKKLMKLPHMLLLTSLEEI